MTATRRRVEPEAAKLDTVFELIDDAAGNFLPRGLRGSHRIIAVQFNRERKLPAILCPLL